MSIYSLESIPTKFHRSIINRDDFFNSDLKSRVEKAFSSFVKNELLNREKPYIFELQGLEGFFVKGERTDELGKDLPPDAHLYRVRKALKIEKIIQENGWEEHIGVPEKYLYFHKKLQQDKGEWYVITKKVQQIDSDSNQNVSNANLFHNLNAIQAKAIATLVFQAAFIDCHMGNFLKVNSEKIMVIDTEPFTRGFFKKITSNTFKRFFIDESIIRTAAYLLFSAALLKNCLKKPESRYEVAKVQAYYLLINQIKTVAKIALLAVIYSYTTIIPITFVAMAIKASLIFKIFGILALESVIFHVSYLIFVRIPSEYGKIDVSMIDEREWWWGFLEKI